MPREELAIGQGLCRFKPQARRVRPDIRRVVGESGSDDRVEISVRYCGNSSRERNPSSPPLAHKRQCGPGPCLRQERILAAAMSCPLRRFWLSGGRGEWWLLDPLRGRVRERRP